jgi:hypothetical protein
MAKNSLDVKCYAVPRTYHQWYSLKKLTERKVDMAKPQAKTLQERMGFVDHDLKTPGHDAIMLWLDDEVKRSLADWLKVEDWSTDDRAQVSDLPTRPGLKVTKTIWEQPVTTGRDYTVGFIDMVAHYEQQGIGYTQNVYGAKAYSLSWWDDKAFFEVKTSISSLGELLRQLGYYRQHLKKQSWDPDPTIFVVCPDARFADKIREQGFGFIQSPGAMPKTNGQAKDDGWLFGRGN